MTQLMTGEEFLLRYPNTIFYKLTNRLEKHNNFHYNDGVNVDFNLFHPIGECTPGGLYFTEYDKIPLWVKYGSREMYYIREVIILPDSKVYIERNKFKADKLFLKSRVKLDNFEGWNNITYCLNAVNQNGHALKYVKEQTEEICLKAVKQNGFALQYVKEPTEQIF